MNDTDKPESVPAQRPIRPGRDRPKSKGEPMPSLPPGQPFGANAPKLHDLDEEIEAELQASLGGLSEKEIFGEPDQGKRQPAPADGGRKKGKVLRIHGPDVFLDVPGG